MRQIKFRAQDYTGTWRYGFIVKGNEAAVIIPVNPDGSAELGINIYVKPETIGQFTGLYDKNGKEIFDGDLVLLEGVGVFNVRYSVSMCQFGLYGENGFVDALKELQADRYEVVGSVFKNTK